MTQLTRGDYVLATKYKDGSPKDHWCVGFFHGMLGDRYLVVDSIGMQFRANGFRRAEKISKEVGKFIVENTDQVNWSVRSLWRWKSEYNDR